MARSKALFYGRAKGDVEVDQLAFNPHSVNGGSVRSKSLEKSESLLRFDQNIKARGYCQVAGVDEAGRGPLAGPVYAAAVILPDGFFYEGINDSKKLSPKKREQLYEVITREATDFCIAAVDEHAIDEINILQATMRAMQQAVGGLKTAPDYVLVDGNRLPMLNIPGEAVVKGDASSLSIAAASILAKVARDRYLLELDARYPQYGFKKHKGYGTREHIQAIRQYGPCACHRQSFLGRIL